MSGVQRQQKGRRGWLRLPSPAMVIALIALSVAAVETGFAGHGGRHGPPGLVNALDVQNESLTGRDIKNKSLTPADFRGSVRGAPGPQGPPGPPGRDGTNGANGTNGRDGTNGTDGTARAYAIIDAQSGAQAQVIRAKGIPTGTAGVRRPATGTYCVTVPGVNPADVPAFVSQEGTPVTFRDVEVAVRASAQSCNQNEFEVFTFRHSDGIATNAVSFAFLVP